MAQTYQNPTFGTITSKTAPTSTTDPYVSTLSSIGVQGKVAPENIPLTIIPPTTHYTPVTPNLKGHLQGIDNAIGNIPLTTAGNTTRVWFTGDATTITAGTFYLTNATNKGTVANVSQSAINDDNQKKYFTQDLIGQPFASTTIFPPGVYAGNLSASTTPNSAQQRFTVELYRCNNAGTPIASGVPGAPVGDLGVTVIIILDSGNLTLADGSVTNVPVSASLASQFSIGVGERIRYHVSAEKVGTASSNITESVWYGNSFNSFIDVPTPITSSGVSNVSTVTGASVTAALDNLNTLKANDADVLHKTGNEIKNGNLGVNNLTVGNNPLLSTPNKITQTVGIDDYWSIYGKQDVFDRSIMIFEVGDNASPFSGVGQKFQFNYNASSSGVAKTAFEIDYDWITAKTNRFTISNTPIANFWSDYSNILQVGQLVYQDYTILPQGSIQFNKYYNGSNEVYINTGGAANIEWMNNGDIELKAAPSGSAGSTVSTGKTLRVRSSGAVNISDLAGTGTRTVVVDASGNLSAVASSADYYVYSALISQSSTSAPTATVLKNTLPGAISVTLTRTGVGEYFINKTDAFTIGKTFISITPNGDYYAYGFVPNDDQVRIATRYDHTLQDGLLNTVSIEIRVYP